jgi:hypothetical protein
MSDTDNSVDGSDFVSEDKAAFAKFAAFIPASYYPMEGFRIGYRARMAGKPMVHEPYYMTEADISTLPEYWGVWYEDYRRGYESADNLLQESEALIVKNGTLYNAWI